MPASFGEYLADLIKRQDLSLRSYARLIGYPTGHSFVSRVVNGKMHPPLKELDRWAKPLKLSHEERSLFNLLAGVANSPQIVQDWYIKHS